MSLNPKKCKDLRMCYFREQPIGGTPQEVVNSHKVLGGPYEQQAKMVRSRVLQCLTVELVSIHVTLIHSILEYCCSVWHTSFPSDLSDKTERMQKRALRIIYPHLSFRYRETMKATNYCPQSKVFKKIQSGGCKLASLIPQTRACTHDRLLRDNKISAFKCNKDRLKRSFFPSITIDIIFNYICFVLFRKNYSHINLSQLSPPVILCSSFFNRDITFFHQFLTNVKVFQRLCNFILLINLFF